MKREDILEVSEQLKKLSAALMLIGATGETQDSLRHGKPWTTWEKDYLKDKFNALIDDAALKLGRTRLSIILHIQNYISKGLGK